MGQRLFLLVLGGVFLFLGFLAARSLELPAAKLSLQGLASEKDHSGATKLVVTGSGFDRRTRLLLTPDFGNRRALLRSLPTWGNLQSVTVAGDLLYLANHYRGMQVFDFSDPLRPRQIGNLQLPGTACKIAVQEQLALVAAREGGVQVVDVRDPRQLRRLGAADLGGSSIDVAMAGSLAFVANAKGCLQVLDLANPTRPTLLATFPVAGNPYALVLAGDTVYLAAARGGLQIVDIGDPRRPRLIGTLRTAGPVFDVDLRDGIAWLAAGAGGVVAADVTNPRAPKEIGHVDTPGTARSISLGEGVVYLADLASGLQAVDIVDPRRPRLLGAYGIPGYAHAVVLAGDRALVAGGTSGLHIVDLRQPTALQPPPAANLPLGPGEQLLYLGTDINEVLVVALGTSSPPRVVSRIPLAGSGRRVQAGNGFLYVLSQGTPRDEMAESPYEIEVFDIRDPLRAELRHRLPVAHSRDLLVEGKNLWLAGKGGLCRFDLADPALPVAAGCLPLPDGGNALARKGSLLLVGGREGTLHTFAVDGEVPRRLGSAALPWHLQAFASAMDIFPAGSLAVVAGGRSGLLIYDVADPTRPELLGALQLPEGNYAGGVTVSGNFACVINGQMGLYLVDLTEPRQPRLVATMDNRNGTREILIAAGQIVFATPGADLGFFPLPVTVLKTAVETDGRLHGEIPDTLPPGNYTLWAFNDSDRAALPGALVIAP